MTGDTSSGVTFGGIRRMRGCAIVIKLRRSGGINTGKDNFFCTFTNIQGVAVTDFIALTIDSNHTGTANIDNT